MQVLTLVVNIINSLPVGERNDAGHPQALHYDLKDHI